MFCGNFLSELKYGLRCDEMIGNIQQQKMLKINVFCFKLIKFNKKKEGFKKLANLICQFNTVN